MVIQIVYSNALLAPALSLSLGLGISDLADRDAVELSLLLLSPSPLLPQLLALSHDRLGPAADGRMLEVRWSQLGRQSEAGELTNRTCVERAKGSDTRVRCRKLLLPSS